MNPISQMSMGAKTTGVIDWERVGRRLDDYGYALTDAVLTPVECDDLIQTYSASEAFRSRVVMARHNFGRGEYKYFADPLPPIVLELRRTLYPQLAEIANRWAVRLKQKERYPTTLAEFLEVCRHKKQTLPTPLMLRYEAGDYNCLHQDLYGEIAFPLQAACVLSRQGTDYSGGEFLLTEQRPRMQTRGEAITIEQGQFIIFPNRWRPVAGTRGDYRVNIRHGVSRLKSGVRYCLGLIFHNAK
ncbi:MAG TPA: 2OG-Fe(II) oxygenase [Blastocatellia bacterium]|nr:2OG-Fe(II) oxygenase [Blastocatellia bacterium]